MAGAHPKHWQELAALPPGMAQTCWKRPLRHPKVWCFEASRQHFPITSATILNQPCPLRQNSWHLTCQKPTTSDQFSCSQRFPAEQEKQPTASSKELQCWRLDLETFWQPARCLNKSLFMFILTVLLKKSYDRSWRCRFFPSLISARFSMFLPVLGHQKMGDPGWSGRHSSQVMSRSPSPCTPSALGSIGKCVSTESLRISGNSCSVYLSYIIQY